MRQCVGLFGCITLAALHPRERLARAVWGRWAMNICSQTTRLHRIQDSFAIFCGGATWRAVWRTVSARIYLCGLLAAALPLRAAPKKGFGAASPPPNPTTVAAHALAAHCVGR